MRGTAGALTLALAGGCADVPPDDPCGQGDVELLLDPDRPGFPRLEDGGRVPVFLPPQGGVFTELDVIMHGIAIEDVLRIRVTIDPPTGDLLATQMYQSVGLPMLCLPEGDISIRRLPVGFADGVLLEELDGVEAELAFKVFTTDGEPERTWDVVLGVTEF